MWPFAEVPSKQLLHAAIRLGLSLEEGSRHTNVIQIYTGHKTQIPRHKKVKRETARSIVHFFIFTMGFSEQKVCEALGVDPPILSDSQREKPELS